MDELPKINVEELREIDPQIYFSGGLSDIISMLEDWKNEGWERITYNEIDWGFSVSNLSRWRLETDAECQKRLKKEERDKSRALKEKEKQKAQKLKDKERRLKEYLKLKKEFEQ